MTTWASLDLQDSASSLMEQLTFFHGHVFMILVMITTLEGYLVFMLFFDSYANRNLLHGQTIEMMWTNMFYPPLFYYLLLFHLFVYYIY